MKKIFFLLLALSISSLTFAQDSGDLENQFYFRFGLSQPTNSYFGIEDKSDWDDIKRIGGVFELGSIFMLNRLPFPDGLRLGINVDYAEFTYHRFNYADGTQITQFIKMASNIGPSLSYSPVPGLVFDAYIKLKMSLGAVVFNGWDSWDDEIYYGAFGGGFATGLNVRYRVFMVAFEFNKDSLKLVDKDDEENIIGNAKDDGDRTPMTSCNITIGFSF